MRQAITTFITTKYKSVLGCFAAAVFLVGCGGGQPYTTSSGDSASAVNPNRESSPPHCYPPLEIYEPNGDQPRLTLLGDKTVVLSVGDTYEDVGALAEDPQSGDISSSVRTFGLSDIDTQQVGDYLLRYEVQDEQGNAAMPEYRFVRVVDSAFVATSNRSFDQVDAPWEYVEHIPSAMGADPAERYPLLIVNHGWSHSKRFDTSGNMQLMNSHSIVRLMRARIIDESLPLIVLVPQRCWSDFGSAQVSILDAFVDWAKRVYPVDADRVYMTGLSMGGWATWEYARVHSEKLAAIAPMAGGGHDAVICGVAPTPVWAFTALDDSVVPASNVINTTQALSQCDDDFVAAPKVTAFSSGGHVIDDDVFDLSYLNLGDSQYDIYDQSIFEWFLQYRLPMQE